MTRFLDVLASADKDRSLFLATGGTITAGRIRATAAEIASALTPETKPLYLYTASASLFVAGLLAAAQLKRNVVCPAHVQPEYLLETGAADAIVLSDDEIALPNARRIAHVASDDANARPVLGDLDLTFLTSGVTGTPKPVHKKVAQLDAEAVVLEGLWGAKAGPVFGTVSHQHIYGMLFRIVWPVIAGRVSADTASSYWEQLSGKLTAGTILVSSPAHLTRLPVQENVGDLRPDLIFSSGALLPYAAAQECQIRLGSLPIEVLGSTEAGGIAWRQQEDPDTLWTPLPSVEASAGDDDALMVLSPFTGKQAPIASGDEVELVGRQFRLKGRTDRIVKIDGKRVSLTRVEEALHALSFVDAAVAVDLPARKGALGALVELTCEGKQVLAKKGSFRLSREMRHQLSARLDPAERPKHWRFGPVERNAQGKTPLAKIRAMFDVPAEKFFGRSRIIIHEAEQAEIELVLTANMIWFEGHFPEQPVLPGVSQVHLAVEMAAHLWSWRPSDANLIQLKFRRILQPNDAVMLTLARDITKGRLKFAFHLGDIIASEGTIGGVA
jgi:3-hydroxymyristoyl/3-hydroxydecanoyl-(acyl carrier protein) dehydratase/acyl-CoA synthetase (AMP-forming)/AMP-acid ligase II